MAKNPGRREGSAERGGSNGPGFVNSTTTGVVSGLLLVILGPMVQRLGLDRHIPGYATSLLTYCIPVWVYLAVMILTAAVRVTYRRFRPAPSLKPETEPAPEPARKLRRSQYRDDRFVFQTDTGDREGENPGDIFILCPKCECVMEMLEGGDVLAIVACPNCNYQRVVYHGGHDDFGAEMKRRILGVFTSGEARQHVAK
jgi:hypothetical protein